MLEVFHKYFGEILVFTGLVFWGVIIFIRYKKSRKREQQETEELLRINANKAANKAKRERKMLNKRGSGRKS